jgi:hypothetical protein
MTKRQNPSKFAAVLRMWGEVLFGIFLLFRFNYPATFNQGYCKMATLNTAKVFFYPCESQNYIAKLKKLRYEAKIHLNDYPHVVPKVDIPTDSFFPTDFTQKRDSICVKSVLFKSV